MPSTYRSYLKQVVSASAAPYGYTLTIWTSGAITSHVQGVPTTVDAVLLLAGAAAGFLLASAVAFGRSGGVLYSVPSHQVRMWGALHLPSVGVAILAASVLAHVRAAEWLTWLGVGCMATAGYLFVIAAQFVLASPVRGASGQARPEES